MTVIIRPDTGQRRPPVRSRDGHIVRRFAFALLLVGVFGFAAGWFGWL